MKKKKEKPWTLTMVSDEYGAADFAYASLKEACEGIVSLCKDIEKRNDGIERSFKLKKQ